VNRRWPDEPAAGGDGVPAGPGPGPEAPGAVPGPTGPAGPDPVPGFVPGPAADPEPAAGLLAALWARFVGQSRFS